VRFGHQNQGGSRAGISQIQVKTKTLNFKYNKCHESEQKAQKAANGAKSAEFCRKSAEFAEFESIFPNFRDERTKSFPL
jgi:hypothetical protein